MPYRSSSVGRRASEADLRRAYRISAADARAHGERPISFVKYKRLVRLQLRLARTDPGGNLTL